jgi:short-subunit dehydrogenase
MFDMPYTFVVKLLSMKHILITGASSGIGAALALHYSQQGRHLSICGRNDERLQNVAEQCRQKGAIVHARALNVSERKQMTDWLLDCYETCPIDLVIVNAGISGGSSQQANWEEATRDVFDVNITGALNSFLPLVPIMINRGQGQIALVSSIAGFRGLASSPAYSASKVMIKAYGEALRIRYKDTGLKVNVICPGFVKSRITDQNNFKMPFLMEADKAARYIASGLKKNKAIIAFPLPMSIAIRLFSLLPFSLVEGLSKLMPNKE